MPSVPSYVAEKPRRRTKQPLRDNDLYTDAYRMQIMRRAGWGALASPYPSQRYFVLCRETDRDTDNMLAALNLYFKKHSHIHNPCFSAIDDSTLEDPEKTVIAVEYNRRVIPGPFLKPDTTEEVVSLAYQFGSQSDRQRAAKGELNKLQPMEAQDGKGEGAAGDGAVLEQLSEGEEKPPALPGAASTSGPEAMLSCRELAKEHGVNYDALNHRLRRWRKTHNNGEYVQPQNRTSKSPKYLYRHGSVEPVIDKMKGKTAS